MKNRFAIRFILLSLLLLCLAFMLISCGQEKEKASEGLTYTPTGTEGFCIVSGIGTCQDTDIIIPSHSPEGDVVVGIASSAFASQVPISICLKRRRSCILTPCRRTKR